jgi:hypothetical protein
MGDVGAILRCLLVLQKKKLIRLQTVRERSSD